MAQVWVNRIWACLWGLLVAVAADRILATHQGYHPEYVIVGVEGIPTLLGPSEVVPIRAHILVGIESVLVLP